MVFIDEEWRDIEGFPGYKISNYGRAMNFRNDPNGVIMHQCIDSQFYSRITVSYKGKTVQPTVHKLVAQAFIENIDNYKVVIHLDGVRENNHVTNLAWGKRGNINRNSRESKYKYTPKKEKYYPVPIYDDQTKSIHVIAWSSEIYKYYNTRQKICYTCHKVKTFDEFNKNKSNKDGMQQRCRECEIAHYRKNKENVSKTHKKYYYENKDKVAIMHKTWKNKNRELLVEKSKAYYQGNKDRIKENYENNKEYKLKKARERYIKKKDMLLSRHRDYYKRNSEAIKEMVHKYSSSERGREVDRLKRSRRKEFGFNPINKPFDGAAFHHLHLRINDEIDKGIGIYIPFELHVSVFHNNYTRQGMDEINKLALIWISEQEVI